MICDVCKVEKDAVQFNRHSTCFKCRVQTVSLGIPHATADSDSWRFDTFKSFEERTIREGRANGLDPVPQKTAGGVNVTAKQLDGLKKHYEKGN